MQITFFETTESEKNILTKLLPDHELGFYSEKLTPETAKLAGESEVVSVFINSPIKKEILDLLPNAKLIQTRSTGFDHLDIPAIKDGGKLAANVPGYGAHTVAEFAFALMLNLSRKVFVARHNVLEGEMGTEGMEGFELFGKTLGVIGTGRIGKNVIKIANGFGMKVLAYDVFPDLNFAKEQNFEYAELEAVMRAADILTLHAPYNEKSHHLINNKNIDWMKKDSYLINTARGELVETDALIRALERGDLAGAGLDVLESERQLKDEDKLLRGGVEMTDYKTLYENHVLMDMPNVILTPHIAFDTKEGVGEILATTAETIKAFAAGAPINLLK